MEGQVSGSRQSGPNLCNSDKMKEPSAGGSKGRGRPRKLSFSPAASRRLWGGLDIGHKVMVRWSDGLFFQGQVLRVDEANDRCQIKFEEGSTFYVLFKDIHRVLDQGEKTCCICKGELSEVTNRIILCNSCSMGYHQFCHNPPVISSGTQSLDSFFCKLCCFAAGIKHGPSLKGQPASAKEDARQVLPYKMNLLTWDAQHRTNVEQCYCYCGGPGDWYCKMLQCCRCRQWFHEACLQCLRHPLLYGDRFFMFVCSHCNQGQEYAKRLPFKWVDVAHLALFNLTLCYAHKYYDLDDIIMPWIAEHMENFEIDRLLDGKSVKSLDIRNKVEAALLSHKSKFTSGREVKKKHTLWALILRIPPNAPSVVVPLSGPINADVLNNPNIKGRKTKQIFPTQCQSPIPLKYPSRSSLDRHLSVVFKKTSAQKVIPEANNNGLTNGFSANQCYSGYNGMQSGPECNGHLSGGHCTSSSESGEDEDPCPPRQKKNAVSRSLRRSSKNAPEIIQQQPPPSSLKSSPSALATSSTTKWPKSTMSVIDRLVPRLPNFDGMNHPFRTEIEKETEKNRVRHFESRVAFLKKEYAGELEAFKLTVAAKHKTYNGVVVQDKMSPTKTSSSSPEHKLRKGVKRKSCSSQDKDNSLKDSVRRSKRNRMNAERYQHLLDSFPRHAPKPDPSEVPVQRWKWLSVMDQLRYGEKFQIQARRTTPDGKLEFLLHWIDEEHLRPMS